MIETIAMLPVLALAIYIIWQLFKLVGDMAEARGQHRTLWQAMSLAIGPFASMIMLWLFVPKTEPVNKQQPPAATPR